MNERKAIVPVGMEAVSEKIRYAPAVVGKIKFVTILSPNRRASCSGGDNFACSRSET